MTQPPSSHLSSLFELEYPQSVGVYDTYPLAPAMIAEMGRPLSWVERLTPGFVMLWVLAVAVAAAITARWPRHQVGWVQAFATLVAAPLLLMR